MTRREMSRLGTGGATGFTLAWNERAAQAAQVASLCPRCKSMPLRSVCDTTLDSSRASVSDAPDIPS